MIGSIIDDVKSGAPLGIISARFHNTLAEIIIEIARIISEQRVVLTGGCFQNKYLTERTIDRLEQEGFKPYWHQRVPPNDGGISLGQIYAVVRAERAKRASIRPPHARMEVSP